MTTSSMIASSLTPSSLVSTIIPVYNRPELVTAAVESVLHQSHSNLEVLLVNDGSTDGTAAVLESLRRQDPRRIRVIHQANAGPGAARERGRLQARGAYIQYLDSDDWLLPHKFRDQIAALEAHPECAIAYGTSIVVDGAGQLLANPSRQTAQSHDQLFPALLVDRWWHTHTPLFRRWISDAAGAWPPFRPEDWDLEARMGALGARLIHCGSEVSVQRDHASAERVSRGPAHAYLRDEAQFLPRLYACALLAGVRPQAPELDHLARWCFMRARDFHGLGEQQQGDQLLRLSDLIWEGRAWKCQTYAALRRALGARSAARLAALARA
jgi:glycosyltransferase involved in cell wall biosynthesis